MKSKITLQNRFFSYINTFFGCTACAALARVSKVLALRSLFSEHRDILS
jgi:hypothetical protein